MAKNDTTPEIVKVLAKDVKTDTIIKVPAEQAKVVNIEALSKTMNTATKGLIRVDVVMTTGINKGNKTYFVINGDEKLDTIPENFNLWKCLTSVGAYAVVAMVGALCYGLFSDKLVSFLLV